MTKPHRLTHRCASASATIGEMNEVRREDDGELCGFVARRNDQWCALNVFGAVLGTHSSSEEATNQVLDEGLASLSNRWILRNSASGDEQVVCIQEANAQKVTLALDYYSLPGVPTMTITAEQLATGEWELRR